MLLVVVVVVVVVNSPHEELIWAFATAVRRRMAVLSGLNSTRVESSIARACGRNM